MPRIARVVMPGAPHHVTQHGDRREDIFFCDADRQRFLQLFADYSRKHGLATQANQRNSTTAEQRDAGEPA